MFCLSHKSQERNSEKRQFIPDIKRERIYRRKGLEKIILRQEIISVLGETAANWRIEECHGPCRLYSEFWSLRITKSLMEISVLK